MPNLHGQLEKMARDITSGPDLSDSVEVVIMGGVLGGLIGYLKNKDKASAIHFATWGAGLGLAGQFMLFHMLKPGRRMGGHYAGAVKGIGGFRGSSMPFGPGPWPMGDRYAAAPDGNFETPNPDRNDPTAFYGY